MSTNQSYNQKSESKLKKFILFLLKGLVFLALLPFALIWLCARKKKPNHSSGDVGSNAHFKCNILMPPTSPTDDERTKKKAPHVECDQDQRSTVPILAALSVESNKRRRGSELVSPRSDTGINSKESRVDKSFGSDVPSDSDVELSEGDKYKRDVRDSVSLSDTDSESK